MVCAQILMDAPQACRMHGLTSNKYLPRHEIGINWPIVIAQWHGTVPAEEVSVCLCISMLPLASAEFMLTHPWSWLKLRAIAKNSRGLPGKHGAPSRKLLSSDR